tara:strand:- start:2156 stop:2956 length:801 start_codon:yes stop_codon:yes gene_type:complete
MNQQEMLTHYENQVREAQLNSGVNQLAMQQQDMSLQDQSKGMVSEQLDLTEVLERINHLLRGYVLVKDENDEMVWKKPVDNDMIILSEYGVNYIMGAVQWYLNKNTLLSNYDDKQIFGKMEDFSTTIVDDVFMEYDKMFHYPTLEDCKTEILARIKTKVDVRKFAAGLVGKKVTERELEAQILLEMEDRIEKEMETIKEQKIKNKLKRFESIMRFVQDTVHSAYQRAWKGQERTTLRQHIHISENKGFNPMPQQQGLNPFGMFRRR